MLRNDTTHIHPQILAWGGNFMRLLFRNGMRQTYSGGTNKAARVV